VIYTLNWLRAGVTKGTTPMPGMVSRSCHLGTLNSKFMSYSATAGLYEPGGLIVRFENEPKNTRKAAPERGNKKRKEPADAHDHLGVITAITASGTDLSPGLTLATCSSLPSSKRFAGAPADSEYTVALSCQDRVLSDLARGTTCELSRSELGAEQQLSQPTYFSFAHALGAVL
jgi:hypothetical protein